VNLQGKRIQASAENIIETLQAVLTSPPKIKPVSTVGKLETMYRAIVAFTRAHLLGIIASLIILILALALWARRRMKRKFGGLTVPSFSSFHEKTWGGSGNGSDGHARHGSVRGASQGKFD
jgi:hypothetical protein